MDDDLVLGPRARRAIPIIAAAIAVAVVGGLLYLHPDGLPQTRYGGPTQVPELGSGYWSTFYFVTPSLGWAAVAQTDGTNVWVFRTTDGSKHWKQQSALTEQLPRAPTVRFFDATHGYVFTDRLYRTADGGAHWEAISIPDATEDFAFATPTRGWAVDNAVQPSMMYATTDGGLTWRGVGVAPVPLYGKGWAGYNFRASGEGWAGGQADAPIVYATFDGGVTWRSIRLPQLATAQPRPSPQPFGNGTQAPAYVTAVLLVPGNGVLAVEDDGFGRETLLLSFDRGTTWQQVAAPASPAGIADITFIDSQHWWASRFGTLFKTSDAGRTWYSVHTVIDLPGDWTLGPANVIDANHAWLEVTSQTSPSVRNQSTALLMTSDGGAHWSPVEVPRPG